MVQYDGGREYRTEERTAHVFWRTKGCVEHVTPWSCIRSPTGHVCEKIAGFFMCWPQETSRPSLHLDARNVTNKKPIALCQSFIRCWEWSCSPAVDKVHRDLASGQVGGADFTVWQCLWRWKASMKQQAQ